MKARELASAFSLS
ncbi:hypothetical protein YPPY46_2229, partial [Yersinia pestis PY-46]